jgi:hypothetical protein
MMTGDTLETDLLNVAGVWEELEGCGGAARGKLPFSKFGEDLPPAITNQPIKVLHLTQSTSFRRRSPRVAYFLLRKTAKTA